ncbi:hypothetical protein [Brevundimonas lenta]|uniref:Uncharacterized protein n=1 Tax=Brevundimonas lenta TaxID=424796 RepID=A0A7W6JBY5_9CAUL|nr:hypothetical protein [Brevundimonas lenta]MBB4081361.1 hypothetical protein [Brevundimonas lenta]
MASRSLRLLRNLLIAALIAAASTWGLAAFWRAIGGGDLPLHGWIALLIGTLGTVGLAWALMALAFKSEREGWDDRVDNTLDPGRDDSDRN